MQPRIEVAVVGHVEWVRFARVARVPRPGQIVHASETWEEPAGGGAVAAVQLAKLGGAATLFTALGDDPLGHRARRELTELGVRMQAVFRPTPQRRAFTFVDDRGERTITTLGERLGPSRDDPLAWDALDEAAAVYFTAGDEGALRAGRRARILVATAREHHLLARASMSLDAIVGSARDPAERFSSSEMDPLPRLVVATEGRAGGRYRASGRAWRRFPSAPVPGPVGDAYGCGDSFAAGLTFGLGAGLETEEALALGARCGAACLTGRGAYAGQLTIPSPDPPAGAGP
ncbi:PfkB family carbohydrate kinase [soil metagenome]